MRNCLFANVFTRFSLVDSSHGKAGDKKATDSKKAVSLETEEKTSPQETDEEIDLEEIVEDVGLQETVTEEAGQETGEKAGEEREECAICFESGCNFVDLPCSCGMAAVEASVWPFESP